MKRILVIRFSSIGDIILTTPVYRCLKMQSECTIHVLTKQSFASALEANPYIDRIITIQKSVKEVRQLLKDQKYDLVLDLHSNIRSMRAKFHADARNIAFNKLNFKKFLLTKFHLNLLPDVHLVDRYMETVKDIGIVNDGAGLDYFIPERDQVNLSEFTDMNLESGFVAVTVGAQHYTKVLPIEHLSEVLDGLKMPILLLGGKQEATRGEVLAEKQKNIVNLCGKLNLNQSADVVRQSSVVMAHDTGLMHMAAAFKKPIVSIWGSTIPGFGVAPYYGNLSITSALFEVNGLPCRPCTKFGKSSCPKGHFKCMKNQDLPGITKAVNELFAMATD
jgi:ADP-heptose:LPS heptosyltransferase